MENSEATWKKKLQNATKLESELGLEAVKIGKGIFSFFIEANKMQTYLQAEKVHLPSAQVP